MLLHAQGVLPGLVPGTWLQEHGNTHLKKCTHSFEPSVELSVDTAAVLDGIWVLPTYEDICKLQCRSIYHIAASVCFCPVVFSKVRAV